MNVFSRAWQSVVKFFKGETVVVETTVASILSDFHKKLDELTAHAEAQVEKAEAKVKEAEAAIAAKVVAETEAAKAKFVHSKIAELLGVNQVPPTV